MKSIRTAFKYTSLIVYTLVCYAVYLLFYTILHVLRLPYEGWRNRLMKVWSKGICSIFSIRVTEIGIAPRPPFILVSNHLSFVDIVILYRCLDCIFVAKKEVRGWPLLGFITKTMGVIFVDRKRKRDVMRVNKLVSEKMNDRQGIIIFPEGTTSAGRDVLPFRAPLLEIPAQSSIPVHFASISYETGEKDPPASGAVCWSGELSFSEHLRAIAANRKIFCTIRFGENPVQSNDRKTLALELRKSVRQIYSPAT